jgi:hypothetical protein
MRVEQLNRVNYDFNWQIVQLPDSGVAAAGRIDHTSSAGTTTRRQKPPDQKLGTSATAHRRHVAPLADLLTRPTTSSKRKSPPQR